MNCCETCQIYWTCDTKWYRGEKGEENTCCPICNYFKVCTAERNKASARAGGPPIASPARK